MNKTDEVQFRLQKLEVCLLLLLNMMRTEIRYTKLLDQIEQILASESKNVAN